MSPVIQKIKYKISFWLVVLKLYFIDFYMLTNNPKAYFVF